MNTFNRHGVAAGLGLVALLAFSAAGEKGKAAAAAPRAAAGAPEESPESIVKRWPARTRRAAELLLEKYGRPAQFDRNTLAWFNNGPWKRTILHREVARPAGPGKRANFLEQSIGYLVPSGKVEELSRFDRALLASPSAGEITYSSDSEATNRLALNLADEIITGKRGLADARAFFKKTARLAESGKSSTYGNELMFDADNSRYMAPTGADR